MTTTPLPPLPWANDFEAWLEVRSEVDVTAAMQDYATQARADLEAENKRLREALKSLCEYTAELNPNQGWDENDHHAIKMARAALEKQP